MYIDNIIFQFIDSSIRLDTLVSINRKIPTCSGKTWFLKTRLHLSIGYVSEKLILNIHQITNSA